MRQLVSTGGASRKKRWTQRTFAILLLAAGFVVVGLVAISPEPAEAQSGCTTAPWAGEQGLVDSCLENFLFDPGAGELMMDDDLSLDVVAFYENIGFDRDWVWYTADRVGQTPISRDTQWAYCTSGVSGRVADELCDVYPVAHSAVGTSFQGTGPVAMSLIGDANTFIARGCGNSSLSTPTDAPTIYVEAHKFHDVNRNGVRDAAEPGLGGWTFDIVRDVSYIGQPTGSTSIDTVTSNTTGTIGLIRLELTANDNFGPGEYRLVERSEPGWEATDDDFLEFTLDFGGGDRTIEAGDIGNARTEADVAKVSFNVAAGFPTFIDARTPTLLTVDVELANLGPAELVEVRDRVVASGRYDCSFDDPDQSIDTTLRRGDPPQQFSFDFIVTCDEPSFHDFTFVDTLTLTEPGVTDPNASNNTATLVETRPVHAYTDLSTSTSLTCPPTTEVGVAIDCAVAVDVSNLGYGPVDAAVTVDLSQTIALDDCSIQPATLSYQVTSLQDGETRPVGEDVTVTCGYRSDHQVKATSTVAAVDIHVFETDPSNDDSAANADFEVFHDAALTADDIQLFCDEEIGVPTFSCTASIDVSNAGPAPDVNTTVTASVAGLPDCVASPAASQSSDLVLAIGVFATVDFTWDLTCTDGAMLHPFRFTADVAPAPDEPHAVDVAGPITDDWTVPYCMETVNPSGNNVPNAPGNGGQGQNQDGFYTFGAKTIDGDADVWIEDDGSGTVWGPFESGVEIKYIEANGAEPSITFMAGNNGGGNGNGNGGDSVDYQIRGQGDAVALHYDEDGNAIRTSCLVPPFPQ